ncbi:MAG: DUF1109 domain-containing protein [Caldimonas sp.]
MMKTENLIAMLARGPTAADCHTTERCLGLAAAAGAVVAALGVFTFLGPLPDISSQWTHPGSWLKVAFPASFAFAAFAASCRLGRPGATLGKAPLLLAGPIAVVALAWGFASVGDLTPQVAGQSGYECVLRIALLALPGLIAGFAALRRLAPTRLQAAGAGAGLLAGAIAATIYSFYCGETRASLVTLWQSLGMSIPVLVGVALGPRWLQWV